MAQTVKLKRTSVAGRIPTTSNIEVGELAFNTNDKALFVRGDADAIVAIHDESTLHIDTTNNRIGIGTTSPSAPLTVNNDTDHSTVAIFHAGGGTPNRGLKITTFSATNANAGVDLDAQMSTGVLSFSTGGSERMRLSAGKLGIGTTSPEHSLHVYDSGSTSSGTIKLGGSAASLGLEMSYTQAGNTTARILANPTYTNDGALLKIAVDGDRNANQLVLDGTGNIGIGTASPDTTLDVTANGVQGIILNQDLGNTSVSSRLFFKDGTRTNTILSVNGNLQFRTGATIGSSSGTNRLVVKGNGTITFNEAYTFPASDGSANQVLQTDGSGNLSFATVQAGGGGTVSEAFKTIAVSGQDNVVADAATDTLTFAAGSGMTITTNASSDTVTFAASSSDFTDSDGDTKIQVEESSDEDIIRFDTAGTERMQINSSGSVGIGTDSPQNTLHVNGTLRVGPYFATSDRDHFLVTPGGTVTTVSTPNENANYDNSAGNIHIRTNSGYATPVERLTVTSAGNVGIGTTSPISSLTVLGANDVQGGITLTTSNSDDTQKVGRIKTQHYDTAEEPFTAILTNAQASHNLINIGGASGAENAATHIKFFTAANNTTLTGTQRMVIDSSGRVGIGETAPSQKLQVNGNIRADGHYYVGGSIIINSNRNLTNIGTKLESSAALTIDTVGQLNLDSGNDEIHLRGSGTTFGKLFTSGGDFYINHPTSDEDILFTGNDGGSTITALHLDMSAGGIATFNSSVIGTNSFFQNMYITSSGENAVNRIDNDGSQLYMTYGGGSARALEINNSTGAVTLKHGTNTKLATTSTGVSVTGALTASGDVTLNNKITFTYNDHYLQTGTNSISFKNSVGTSYATLSNTTLSLSGDLSINDSKILKLGNASDLQLLHDGTNSIISNSTGDLQIIGHGDDVKILAEDDVVIRDNDDSTNMAHFVNGGSVDLYYAGVKKFETEANGIKVTSPTGYVQVKSANASYAHIETDRPVFYFNKQLSVNEGIITSYDEDFQLRRAGSTKLTLGSTEATFTTDIVAKDSNSTTDPSITFTGHTDSGFSISNYGSGSTDQINIIRDGAAMALINQAGITSNANLYTSSTGAFRNYGGVWKGTTGTSGDGFQFVNTADSVTAMDLSASGNVTFAGTITSTGNMTVGGNLTVNGTTTTLNTATLDVEDKNITLNKGSGDTSGSANGAGITIQDAVNASTDATMLWDAGNDKFTFSHPIHPTNILISDSNKIRLGNSQDLEIYHDGSFSYIKDLGTGGLYLDTNGDAIYLRGTTGNKNMVKAIKDGSVELYYNGSKKFETTNEGVEINDTYDISSENTTTSATTQTTIDTFTASAFRSCRYTIQVSNTTDTEFHTTELLLVHDGTTPGITEFGTIFTGAAAEATFDADISSGNVRLRATPASTDSMTFKVIRHAITT